MRNEGRVVTRGALLEHVWDNSVDEFTNSIDTHILHLRRKIDPKNNDAFIHTVPGVGYIVGRSSPSTI
jgi:two-component system copper resistance phosphate regulon response regulator CusR